MKGREIKKLMVHNKFKELLGLLETFNVRLEVWEFQLVLVNNNGEKVATIGMDYIDWEGEYEDETI